MKFRLFCLLLALLPLLLVAPAEAREREGRLRELLETRRANNGGESGARQFDEDGMNRGKMSCVEKVAQQEKLKKFLSRKSGQKAAPSATLQYGEHELQAIDVYMPEKAANPAPYPIMVYVHGGGWCIGDKAQGRISNKINHWLPKGFIFVSVNYRMIADGVYPAVQAKDVAGALALVQQDAKKWNGDASRIILMGHSAGAHLVSLVGTSPKKYGLKPWLGTVSLDGAGMDIPGKMSDSPAYLYQEAFGSDPKYWEAVSPLHQLNESALPWLGVCSSKRKDACPSVHAYAEKSNSLGIPAFVQEETKGHGAINKEIGEDKAYTARLETFMKKLDGEVKKRLES